MAGARGALSTLEGEQLERGVVILRSLGYTPSSRPLGYGEPGRLRTRHPPIEASKGADHGRRSAREGRCRPRSLAVLFERLPA